MFMSSSRRAAPASRKPSRISSFGNSLGSSFDRMKSSASDGDAAAAAHAASIFRRGESGALDGSASDRRGPLPNRFDTDDLSGILDDMDEEGNIDLEANGLAEGPEIRRRARSVLRNGRGRVDAGRVLICLAALGIVLGLSIGISTLTDSITEDVGDGVAGAGAGAGDDSKQRLLDIAERVVRACSEEMLNEGAYDCRNLCDSSVRCCFDAGEESCDKVAGVDCAVYAGCEALLW